MGRAARGKGRSEERGKGRGSERGVGRTARGDHGVECAERSEERGKGRGARGVANNGRQADRAYPSREESLMDREETKRAIAVLDDE